MWRGERRRVVQGKAGITIIAFAAAGEPSTTAASRARREKLDSSDMTGETARVCNAGAGADAGAKA